MLLTRSIPYRGMGWRLDVVGSPEEVLAHLAQFVVDVVPWRKHSVAVTQAMHAARLYVSAQAPDRTVRLESQGNNVAGMETLTISLTSFVESSHVCNDGRAVAADRPGEASS